MMLCGSLEAAKAVFAEQCGESFFEKSEVAFLLFEISVV
jgi:hypothetical protein